MANGSILNTRVDRQAADEAILLGELLAYLATYRISTTQYMLQCWVTLFVKKPTLFCARFTVSYDNYRTWSRGLTEIFTIGIKDTARNLFAGENTRAAAG